MKAMLKQHACEDSFSVGTLKHRALDGTEITAVELEEEEDMEVTESKRTTPGGPGEGVTEPEEDTVETEGPSSEDYAEPVHHDVEIEHGSRSRQRSPHGHDVSNKIHGKQRKTKRDGNKTLSLVLSEEDGNSYMDPRDEGYDGASILASDEELVLTESSEDMFSDSDRSGGSDDALATEEEDEPEVEAFRVGCSSNRKCKSSPRFRRTDSAIIPVKATSNIPKVSANKLMKRSLIASDEDEDDGIGELCDLPCEVGDDEVMTFDKDDNSCSENDIHHNRLDGRHSKGFNVPRKASKSYSRGPSLKKSRSVPVTDSIDY
jgi:hypothetical protein